MKKISPYNKSGAVRGFTLTEIMIVVTILAVIMISAILAFQKQIERGFDAKRKTDLGRIQTAFEDYYNDRECYPTLAEWEACYDDGRGCRSSCAALTPYLEKFLCDPRNNTNYYYIPTDNCAGYRMYTTLQDVSDPDIARVGCGLLGCGYGLPAIYNYGISVGAIPLAEDGFLPNPTAGPTVVPTSGLNPTMFPGTIACLTYNDCGEKSSVVKAIEDGCGRTFLNDDDCHTAGCCGGCTGLGCDCDSEPKPAWACTQ